MHRRQLLAQGAGLGLAGPWMKLSHAAEPGVSTDEILLGQSCVLSGPLGVSLQGFNAGAKLAFDDANAKGGVAGRRIRVETLDDELKPDRAVANYRLLLEEKKVFAFFGGVGSGTTAAVAPLLKASGAVLVGNYAVSDAARRQAQGHAFFLRAPYGREAQKIVQHLTTLGIHRIAVAHLDNPGGVEVVSMLNEAMATFAKGKPLAAAAPVKNDGSNIDEAIDALAKASPQAVVMFLSGPPVSRLMSGMAARGLAPSYYGMSTVAGERVAADLGDKLRGLAICQVVPLPWAAVEPTTRAYQQLAETAQVPVSYYSFEGYLNAMVMLEALRRCGKEPTRAGLQKVMQSLRMRLAGVDIDFTDSHTGSRFVEMVQVRPNGKFVR
ncbi:ABC transporter substrate-binding protein [Ideonella livida]|uniref:ABC transporter substrate-binding protein n=1 Tax=Ideonella livida TaxID=2707176 RepID=A0A7C9TL85_9BURK|nr:ABC transporter substrate-binding protein [Ideonella livida]NDY93359.1 ABC transporter substrate-binding protein [Ideonella livida]